MDKEQVLSAANEAGVRLNRLLYYDNGCVIRGKLVSISAKLWTVSEELTGVRYHWLARL